MKNIILAVALLSIMSLSAVGQQAGVRTWPNGSAAWNGGTNNVAATSTNTVTDAISVSEFDNVGYQITVKPISTSTGTVVFKFADSLDSTSYESVPSRTVTCTLNGTSAITTVGNFTIPSTGTLRLASIVNTNEMAITNIAVVYRVKAPKVLSR